VVVTVRSCCLKTGEPGVETEVQDTGRGIPEVARGAIFEPFYSTSDPGESHGLGLAISSELVKEWGGVIDLLSEEGKGTVFTVRLPACLPGKVLIMDQDPEHRMRLATILREAGLEPISAVAAEDGLALLEGERCDLAVLDMRVPAEGSLEALSTFKAKWPDLPVLAISAANQAAKGLSKEYGALTVLREPFSSGKFLSAVRTNMRSAKKPRGKDHNLSSGASSSPPA
jgi:CheY-like chemotaxis protein